MSLFHSVLIREVPLYLFDWYIILSHIALCCINAVIIFIIHLALESKISQMPVVLIPIHFDRNPDQRPFVPSCQRSIVLRPFISSDFMTGIPATPDNDIPMSVSDEYNTCFVGGQIITIIMLTIIIS